MASGLTRWFKEDWVDLSRPKKGGGYEPCGRDNTHSGHYPKCVPAARAEKMTPEQIKSAISRKRRAESTQTREDKKPIMVETVKKENVPADMELYNRVKAAAKAKFDVYPSAYANGWLVQEYKRRGGKYKTVSKDSPTTSDVHVPVIMGSKKKRDLKKKKMAMDFALRKEQKLKDPKGGLTAAGRAKFNRETGSKLKPGVKGKADTPEKMRRKGSFLTRFFTNPSGPMVNDKGEPTRLALSAAAWGEPVPKNRSDAAKLAEKGRNLLERYKNVSKGESAGHPFRGNQWTRGGVGMSDAMSSPKGKQKPSRAFKNPQDKAKAEEIARGALKRTGIDDNAVDSIMTGKAPNELKGIARRFLSSQGFTDGQIREFVGRDNSLGKGESQGHPFRGNQWTKSRGGVGLSEQKSPKKTAAQKSKEVNALTPTQYKRYINAPIKMKHDEAMKHAKTSPLKGQPRPKAPTKQGDAQLKGRITPLDAASKVRAIKVHEYMKKPASNFKDPAIRKYALVRIKQMTTGVARPSGMSKKYGIDAGQVRSTEIVLSKIFAAGRKKFDI